MIYNVRLLSQGEVFNITQHIRYYKLLDAPNTTVKALL